MKNFLFSRHRLEIFCLIFSVLPLTIQAQSQPHKITGTVSDNSGVLPGVSIIIKNSQTATISNGNGGYTIEAKPTDTLVFSFIGYKTQYITVNNQTKINVILQDDATQLQEVKVNAGYYSVKEKERTGSIAKVSSKDIEKQPVTNVIAVMQGRMAGVEVTQDSGAPGGAFQIKIRGQNSLRADGNQPLYIIDGVSYSSETIGSLNTSGMMPTMTSPLNSINPSDIESIEILKDADATAIYGSRGANGVVLITTKKGKSDKTVFSVNASTGVASVTKKLDLMNTQEYLAMRAQAFANDGITTYPDYAYDINGTWSQDRYTDWQEELIGGTAEINNLQASVSGGSKNTQYLLSGNTRLETTVYPKAFKYRKSAAHFSMNHTADNNRFKLNFSANYTAQNNNQPATDLTAVSRTLAPNAPALYDANGSLNWENSTWDNPLALLESEFFSKIKDFNANAVLSYNILPNLQLKTSLGYTDLRSNESNTQPSTMYNPAYGLGSEISGISNNITSRTSWIAEPQINGNWNLGKAKVEALLGTTFQSQITNRLFQSGFGFSSNSLIHDIASANLKAIDLSDEAVYNYQAVFARINYNYDSRYILNITGRRDGSSRFGPGKQFANFGAVGAAWVFSEEKLLQGNSILSFGKLRTSYGTTGNDQIGDYQFLDTYVSSGNTYQGTIGLQPIRLFNPEFGWETNKKFEAALEAGFFQDRIFLTSAYYNNRSTNQLVGIPLPGTTGFQTLQGNLDATVQNTGLEFTLASKNIAGNDFSWTTNFNISFNRNKLLSYPGLETSPYANTYVVGQSVNIVKLYHYTGFNPLTNLYEFEDVNNDGQITSLADRQTIANLSPKYFGGLQNNLRYKNLQLDFLFHFVKQQSFGYMPGVPGTAVNQLSEVSHQQLPFTSGANGEVIAAYYRYGLSDAALQDASFVRLKNVSLTYDIPLKTKDLKCQLYFQGQNLLTFTPYNSGDPEFKFSGYLPPLRVFTTGVKLTL
ncbi:SusC/RagA family TonB-linked outer membrane protein [Flavobacterium suncheonense]|uniref:TonB-dependent receptor n=1 Tax=Flavobacterium suncheonense GH29-5 = DSM 17707 TaxID=1121899 RepID=A0A0A2MGI3_9FLAO|nr:SusC/RagA family TonB-linked outer membrane protein [Flavobacterium suncheonense]KGO90568.1 TonB-dependent receptor [Flavobacterium suncheonense GH29-5 = DSM 17707]